MELLSFICFAFRNKGGELRLEAPVWPPSTGPVENKSKRSRLSLPQETIETELYLRPESIALHRCLRKEKELNVTVLIRRC
jgi:hypothetical protein